MLLPQALTFLAATAVHALSEQEWQKQSIYSVMVDRFARDGNDSTSVDCGLRDYCGGTWKGIEEKLDYIQGMGFTAIWISPIIENIAAGTPLGDPFHGYWPKDIYSLNSHFGTQDDLLSLSDAIHDRGMALMLDVVPNHMASAGPFNTTDFSALTPFNSSSYFHRPCWLDDSNATAVRVCMTGDTEGRVTLADLRTEDANVREIFQDWIRDTVETYNIDGLRLDSAKHIESSFWPGFLEAAGAGAGSDDEEAMFALAEWLDGDPASYPAIVEAVGTAGAMNYAVFYWIQRAWQTRSASFDEMTNGINLLRGTLGSKTTSMGIFTENHDQLRLASITGDLANTKTAMAFAHLMDGIPVVYQGSEQHFSGSKDPSNRQPMWSAGFRQDKVLYEWYARLNAIRQLVIATDASFLEYQATPVTVLGARTNATLTSNTTSALPPALAIKKGDVVSVYTNMGVGGARVNMSLPATSTQYIADTEYIDLISCEVLTASTAGALSFEMGELPRVFYPADKAEEFEMCASGAPEENKDTCIVKFSLTATTDFGQLMLMAGNIDAIGSNDIAQAVLFDSSTYPLWTLTVEVPSGSALEYQYLKMSTDGTITWDGGAKDAEVRTFAVPEDCRNREKVTVPAETFGAGDEEETVVVRKRQIRKGGSWWEKRTIGRGMW